jgi:hypothetical protein
MIFKGKQVRTRESYKYEIDNLGTFEILRQSWLGQFLSVFDNNRVHFQTGVQGSGVTIGSANFGGSDDSLPLIQDVHREILTRYHIWSIGPFSICVVPRWNNYIVVKKDGETIGAIAVSALSRNQLASFEVQAKNKESALEIIAAGGWLLWAFSPAPGSWILNKKTIKINFDFTFSRKLKSIYSAEEEKRFAGEN